MDPRSLAGANGRAIQRPLMAASTAAKGAAPFVRRALPAPNGYRWREEGCTVGAEIIRRAALQAPDRAGPDVRPRFWQGTQKRNWLDHFRGGPHIRPYLIEFWATHRRAPAAPADGRDSLIRL